MDKVSDEILLKFYLLVVVFLFLSFYEGFGIFILEVMVCGIFVIIFNVIFMLEVVDKVVLFINFELYVFIF